MVKQLDIYPELKEVIEQILYQGHAISFNPGMKSISIGCMFGFLKEKNGYVAVANRISVIRLAFISCMEQFKEIQELPSEIGYADVVYLPKQKSVIPALVVELKWNKSSEGANNGCAIRQIKERNYPAVLKDYGGEVVIVGISYDAKKKKHSYVIDKELLRNNF